MRKQTVPQLYFPLISTEGGNVLHSTVGSRVASYHQPPNLSHIHTWYIQEAWTEVRASLEKKESAHALVCFLPGVQEKSLTASISHIWPLTIWKQGLEPRSRDDERSAMNLRTHSLTTHDSVHHKCMTLMQMLYGDQLYLESICIHLFNQQVLLSTYSTLSRTKHDMRGPWSHWVYTPWEFFIDLLSHFTYKNRGDSSLQI